MKLSRKDIAYNYLHDAIISHELAPGSPIVEQEISDRLNISRTPVREAMKQLEAEGMIKSLPVRCSFVTEITLDDLVAIFDLREVLEALALKTSIKRISDEEILETEAMLGKLNEQCSREEFYQADRALHDMITHNSGNSRLVKFLENMNSQIERYRYIAALKPERLNHSREEHEKILKLIKARNLEKATECLREHIHNVRDSVISVCEKQMNKVL